MTHAASLARCLSIRAAAGRAAALAGRAAGAAPPAGLAGRALLRTPPRTTTPGAVSAPRLLTRDRRARCCCRSLRGWPSAGTAGAEARAEGSLRKLGGRRLRDGVAHRSLQGPAELGRRDHAKREQHDGEARNPEQQREPRAEPDHGGAVL